MWTSNQSPYKLIKRSRKQFRVGSHPQRYLRKHICVATCLVLFAGAIKLQGVCFLQAGCQLVPRLRRTIAQTSSVARPSGADLLEGPPGTQVEEGKPKQHSLNFEDVKEGMVVDGTVLRNLPRYGVFMDIGCGRDAKLAVASKVARRERVKNLAPGRTLSVVVSKVNAETKQVDLALDSSVPQQWDDDRQPVENFKNGTRTTGKILRFEGTSVHVDVGCKTSAILKASKAVKDRLQIADYISDFVVEQVNLTSGKLFVTSMEAERLVAGREPGANKRVAQKPSDESSPAPVTSKKIVLPLTRADDQTMTTGRSTLNISVAADSKLKQGMNLNVKLQGLRILKVDTKRNRLVIALGEP